MLISNSRADEIPRESNKAAWKPRPLYPGMNLLVLERTPQTCSVSVPSRLCSRCCENSPEQNKQECLPDMIDTLVQLSKEVPRDKELSGCSELQTALMKPESNPATKSSSNAPQKLSKCEVGR